MNKITIELSPQAKQNLLVFLERTQLSGKEVPAYLELMRSIHAVPIPNKEEEVEK